MLGDCCGDFVEILDIFWIWAYSHIKLLQMSSFIGELSPFNSILDNRYPLFYFLVWNNFRLLIAQIVQTVKFRKQHRLHTYPTPSSPNMLTAYRTIVQLSKSEKLPLTKSQSLFKFHWFFPWCPFFCSRIQAGSRAAFNCHVSLVPSLWQFLRLSLSFMTLALLMNIDQLLCQLSLSLGLE